MNHSILRRFEFHDNYHNNPFLSAYKILICFDEQTTNKPIIIIHAILFPENVLDAIHYYLYLKRN